MDLHAKPSKKSKSKGMICQRTIKTMWQSLAQVGFVHIFENQKFL